MFVAMVLAAQGEDRLPISIINYTPLPVHATAVTLDAALVDGPVRVRRADNTAEVPVVMGEGVDHWTSRQPAGLKSASVAWAAPFPGDASGEQAVLYQFPWANPRPDAEIVAIDLAYGPQGKSFGTPVLIAITAGTRAR